MSNNRFDRPLAPNPEEEARLRRTYGQMRFAAKQQHGLSPEQEEHTGPRDYAPNKHVVTGLPAVVDGKDVQATLFAGEYKTSHVWGGVSWRNGNQGIAVRLTEDRVAGTLTPKIERITYANDWGQWSEPVTDPSEAAHYLDEADRLALTL